MCALQERETAAAESSFKESNSLYVLDENLEIIGEIHDLCPGGADLFCEIYRENRVFCDIPSDGSTFFQ